MAFDAALEGLRVLVVEDEMLVSLMIEQILAKQRCIVVGPFDRIEGALAAAQHEAVDLAVLDVNINGVKIYPVAEVLAARSIPFVLVSGYGRSAIPLDRPDWTVCEKPFRAEELIAKLVAELQPR
ncbi:MAG: response regulator receiver protein [Rhodospirillales bacterium]|nr:response regulator receiver protein [Rhodospirillales bacterium]